MSVRLKLLDVFLPPSGLLMEVTVYFDHLKKAAALLIFRTSWCFLG